MTMDARFGGVQLGAALQLPVDADPEETREWLDAFDGVVHHVRVERERIVPIVADEARTFGRIIAMLDRRG